MNGVSIKSSRILLGFLATIGTSPAVELNFDLDEEPAPPPPVEAPLPTPDPELDDSDIGITLNFDDIPLGPPLDMGEIPGITGVPTDEMLVTPDALTDEIPTEASTSSYKPTFSGKLIGRQDHFFSESILEPDQDFYFAGELALELTGSLPYGLTYQLSPRMYFDSDDRVSGNFEFLEDSARRPALTFQEAYAAYYQGNYEIKVGKQIISWGTGDAFKPTDVINPGDYLSVPDNFKIGVPAISVFRTGEKVNVELVAMPFFTPARLPGSDNRWGRDTSGAAAEFQSTFGTNPTIINESRQEIGGSPSNLQGGVQLTSSSLIDGWDLALSYFHGFYTPGVIRATPTPPTVVPPNPVPTDPGSLAFKVFYPEYDQFGASFSTTEGDFEIHGEIAYHITKDELLDDDYFSYLIGVNHTLDDGLPDWIERVTTVLEYAGEHITRSRPGDSPFNDSGFSRAFTNSVFTRILVKFDEDTELEIGGAINIDEMDRTLSVAARKKFFGDLEIEAGFNIFAGDKDSFYGGWRQNDRIYAMATYYF